MSASNNNIVKMKKDLIENYHDLESNHFSYYKTMGELISPSCCTVVYPFRTSYDQYWNTFYCKKTMNTDTDLLSIQFT
jgi:hypothetical protein